MTKHQDIDTMLNSATPFEPVKAPDPPPKLTQTEKLMRWAECLLARSDARMVNDLEYWSATALAKPIHTITASTPFEIAADDPVFKAAGLKDSSVNASLEFFGLTKDQLHVFTCDCGGRLNNVGMADRLEYLAMRAGDR